MNDFDFFFTEIDNSPLYQEAIEWSITGSMTADADKMITHPALTLLEKTNVLKAGVYISGGISVGVKGTIKDVKPVGEKAFTRETAFADLFANGCLEFGLKTELLVAKSLVECEAKGYAKGCLQGRYRYYFTDKKDDDHRKFKFSIPPVVLGVRAKIKTKGWVEFDLVDYEGEIAITDEIILYQK